MPSSLFWDTTRFQTLVSPLLSLKELKPRPVTKLKGCILKICNEFFYQKLIPPSLNPQHPRTPFSPSHFLQTTNMIHFSQLITNFSSLSTKTTYISHPNPHPNVPIRPLVILHAILARSRMRGCTFLLKVDRCHPPQPSD